MFVLGCAGMVWAQAPSGLSAEVQAAYSSVKNNILKSADKMPAENYSFKPTPEVRSFAEVLDHIADSQMRACSAVLGEAKTPNASGKTAKAEVVAALQESFAECDKAYDSLTDANASEMIKMGPRQRTRLGALVGNMSHDNEQYGILTVHLRLKGLVPAASERPMAH
jgi:uncharacterized damage-inducible protein DinB